MLFWTQRLNDIKFSARWSLLESSGVCWCPLVLAGVGRRWPAWPAVFTIGQIHVLLKVHKMKSVAKCERFMR